MQLKDEIKKTPVKPFVPTPATRAVVCLEQSEESNTALVALISSAK
jgi:hypothetical protein